MEFLRSFLRRHFAGKPLVASRNVGCFLRLLRKIVEIQKFWGGGRGVGEGGVECEFISSFLLRYKLIDGRPEDVFPVGGRYVCVSIRQ